MKNRYCLILSAFLFVSFNAFTQDNLWSPVSNESTQVYLNTTKDSLPGHFRLIRLNRTQASTLQTQAPVENLATPSISSAQFEIPLPEGKTIFSSLVESPILSQTLQQQYSDIKTYQLINPVTRNLEGRITITSEGVTGIIFTDNGSIYINPVGNKFPDVHMIYYIRDSKMTSPVLCETKEELAELRPAAPTAGDCQVRTYRLAVAATGEYTVWAGSQANAISYITTTVNNATAIYERDNTIRFTLVTNNSVLFTDPATDPYGTTLDGALLTTNHNTLTAALGSGAFDVGMLFNRGWNGGLAALSVVCNNSFKGRSASGLLFGTGSNPTAGPQGPIFDGTVAHELAHQFSATHSFAATNGGCAGNATAATAYEPGGGSSIMAYAGVCTGNSYQSYADLYFHAGSIAQIQSYAIASGTCATTSSNGNSAPTISVPASAYTIPISTPFTLASTGSDADGNSLTYTWEQMDAGVTTASPPLSTNVSGPNFRSFQPGSSSSRTFPNIAALAAATATPYEVLASVARTMNFRVTVRDGATGGGCTAEANVAVTTNAGAGPFTVTSQNTATSWTANGSNTAVITWNVANTTSAPVNCAAVNILFSLDGGLTYPYTLVSNTANDGTETITVPNLPTATGRIKVEAANNIFFNINSASITITSICSAEGTVFTPASNVTSSAGNAALNLTLAADYGSIVTPTGTLSNTDPDGYLSVNNLAAPACNEYSGNSFRHDTYTFTPSVTGTYTFTLAGGIPFGTVFNLYNGTSFNPVSACSNFIISNATYNGSGVALNGAFSIALTQGVYYTLAVGTFSNSLPALPANYTINVSGPGNIYDGATDPGASFNYTFVIVDNATGNIKAIDASADLSNATTFPAGTYTVYGFSYSNSISLPTLNGYVNGPFSTLTSDIFNNPAARCGNLSKNSITVNVLTTLPVQFLTLKAHKINNEVLLKWGTASEQNSSHFEVLRSTDGIRFNTVVGTVKATGNSSRVVNYELTDYSPSSKWNYYRIKQIDKDGHELLSNITRINFSDKYRTAMVYPNPVKSNLLIEYITEKSEHVRIVVMDSKGAIVRKTTINARAGKNIHSLNVSSLTQGGYSIQFISDENILTARFIKE